MAQLTIQQTFDLALRHHQAGQLQDAEQLYRQILIQEPTHAQATHLLGVIAHQVGRNNIAEDLIRRAIALNPNFPEAHSDLGKVLKETGQFDEAIAACRQAIALRPNYAEAYSNLGNALKEKGLLDESIAAYRQAIFIKPNYAEANYNLGTALKDKGQLDDSIAVYRQAIILRPNFPEAYTNLGNALQGNGQLDEAIVAYRQAIALRPDYAEAYSNLGLALKDRGELDEAIAAHRQAIVLKPDFAHAYDNLLFTLHYHPAYDAQAIAEEHRRWNRQHAQPLRKFIQPHLNDRNPDRRLRIGYVGDLGDHPIGRFMLPLLSAHDHSVFEIFCYSQARAPDKMTAKLQAFADAWRSIVGNSDEQVAELIRQDKIDILVDLAMHSGGNRLPIFAHKPAPVQVTYLAYAAGTALNTIDYRLTDQYLDPTEADDRHYMEKSIRLTGTYWCYQQSVATEPVNQLPASHAGHITFACLNNFSKVTRVTLELWAKLLQMLPNARLLLYSPVGSHRVSLMQFLEDRGIAADRLELIARLSPEQYFQMYQRADIALDPFPFAGGTTTCDALWMGVPVVTLAGRTAVGRAGVSILSNAGLPEMIARSPEQYLQIAVDLATDLRRLAELRSTLRQRMERSELMDAPKFARNIEEVYRQIWRIWCQTG